MMQYQENPYNYEELTEKIWDWQWTIGTRKAWTYTEFQYENQFVDATGDVVLDEIDQMAWVRTTRNISELVEMHDKGHEFFFINDETPRKVFDIIYEYTCYVAWFFNNEIHVSYEMADQDEKLRTVLNDVVKMQNLANKIFPIFTAQPEQREETRGLFGYLNRRHRSAFAHRLQFDPILVYGYNQSDFTDPNRYNREERSFNAIDVRQSFNPGLISLMNQVG